MWLCNLKPDIRHTGTALFFFVLYGISWHRQRHRACIETAVLDIPFWLYSTHEGDICSV
jgi:hypothetical protein